MRVLLVLGIGVNQKIYFGAKSHSVFPAAFPYVVLALRVEAFRKNETVLKSSLLEAVKYFLCFSELVGVGNKE